MADRQSPCVTPSSVSVTHGKCHLPVGVRKVNQEDFQGTQVSCSCFTAACRATRKSRSHQGLQAVLHLCSEVLGRQYTDCQGQADTVGQALGAGVGGRQERVMPTL